jgi:hypothetical protein
MGEVTSVVEPAPTERALAEAGLEADLESDLEAKVTFAMLVAILGFVGRLFLVALEMELMIAVAIRCS